MVKTNCGIGVKEIKIDETTVLKQNVVSFMLRHFLEYKSLDALRMAIKFTEQFNLDLHAEYFKVGKYEELLEKYNDRIYITDAELKAFQRGSAYKKGFYIYNNDLNKFGVVRGYYLSNDKKSLRYKVLIDVDQDIEKLEKRENLKSTDWKEESDLVFFTDIQNLKLYISQKPQNKNLGELVII